MSDLTDFLLARIAEDEELLTRPEAFAHRSHGYDAVGTFSSTCPTCRQMIWGSRERGLAECEAKRRIVDWHRLVDGLDGGDKPVRGCPNCIASGAEAPYLIAGPCLTVRLLALPYADHPDYRSEWAP